MEEILIKLGEAEEQIDQEIALALKKKEAVLAETEREAAELEQQEIERYARELAQREREHILEIEKTRAQRMLVAKNNKSVTDTKQAVELILQHFEKMLGELRDIS